MSTRTILVVFLALICGAAMAMGVLQASRPKKVGPVDVTETEPVLVAVVDIASGKVVAATDIEVRQWPKGLAPASTLRKAEEAVKREAIGQVLKGEFVLDAKLAPKDAAGGLAVEIPKGMRAYTIQTARVGSNVAGFVLPGNKVDVLLNMKAGGPGEDDTGGGSTTTLLQAVTVLAVAQRRDAPAENKVDPKEIGSVTLLVTPDQVNLLDLGQNVGILALSLRNPADEVDANTVAATVNKIRFRGEGATHAIRNRRDVPPSANHRPTCWLVAPPPPRAGRFGSSPAGRPARPGVADRGAG